MASARARASTHRATDSSRFALFTDASPHYPPAALVKREHLQDSDSLISPNPVRIELRRATLAPGETLPPPAAPFEIVGAESKYLGRLIPHLDGSFTNGEKQPLGVLILTITPLGSATPTP